jgi:alpha-beta hydrolase superfamily lysophospholipase
MKRAGVVGLAVLVACSTSNGGSSSGGTDGGSDAPSVTPGSFAIEVDCKDSVDAVYADPGALPADKGALIKCVKEKDLTKDQLQATAKDYVGKPFTSGAHVYRVLYRTERGDAAATPGYSSATVYIPDTPRVPAGGAALLPVIVSSHGTAGQAPQCAPTKTEGTAYMNYPIVGSGFAVIAPDLAGYANYGAANNPPSAYAQSADVGKSTLDGARALRKMFPSSLSDKVVIVGHSQGGGTALSALAMADSYGSGGTVAGVVAYAPLWLNEASWGALPLLADTYPFSTSAFINAVDIWYIYTHGELLDGAGHGGDPFVASKRAAIKSLVDTQCDFTSDLLAPLGNNINDVLDPAWTLSVKSDAALGSGCGDALCTTWHNRFAADRPHLTGAAGQVPILLPYGGKDTTIPPERMACVVDRLDTDKAAYKLCYQPDAAHTPVVNVTADYANDWIAARTLGGAEPAPCPGVFPKPTCATPPPND